MTPTRYPVYSLYFDDVVPDPDFQQVLSYLYKMNTKDLYEWFNIEQSEN